MSFVRHKIIGGHRYYYRVHSVRVGDTVRQVHEEYIGKSPGEALMSDAEQLLKDLQAGKHGERMTKEEYASGEVRPETYYHVVRSDKADDLLKNGIKGREEVDGKRHIYLWDNRESAERYVEMLKEDFPNASHTILAVRVPKKDSMETWSTYGIPGAKSVDSNKIDAHHVHRLASSKAKESGPKVLRVKETPSTNESSKLKTFYHVTKRKELANIEKDGLKAKSSPWWTGRRVFLWDRKEDADYYASWVRGGDKGTGLDENIILKVRAPAKDITTPNKWDDPHIKASKKSIPPDHIEEVEKAKNVPKTRKSTIFIPGMDPKS